MTTDDWDVRSIFHININCRDLDRSVAFYEQVGFVRTMESPGFDGEVDASYEAMGVSGRVSHKGPVVLFLGDNPRQTRLDLMQWDVPAAPAPVRLEPTQVGVPRMALWTKNVRGLYDELSAKGVEFISEPAGPFEDRAIKAIVCLYDPDGLMVELIEFLPGGRSLYKDASGS